MVSTHLKNICQIGSFPQVGVKIKNIWNHHLVMVPTQVLDESFGHCFCHPEDFNSTSGPLWSPDTAAHLVVIFLGSMKQQPDTPGKMTPFYRLPIHVFSPPSNRRCCVWIWHTVWYSSYISNDLLKIFAQNLVKLCSTNVVWLLRTIPTLLLSRLSLSRENGHPLFICSSLPTTQ